MLCGVCLYSLLLLTCAASTCSSTSTSCTACTSITPATAGPTAKKEEASVSLSQSLTLQLAGQILPVAVNWAATKEM